MQRVLGELQAFYHFDHSVGTVGPNIVSDDGVRTREIVACHRYSPSSHRQGLQNLTRSKVTSCVADDLYAPSRVSDLHQASGELRSSSSAGRSLSSHSMQR